MKVRIKFAKEGMMKFIGHLDIMRYFQKAIRRAELPIAYSGGFSPHMILSFAAPLGVGITSLGEYFDMELTEELPTEEIRSRLDREMVEGMRILSARRVPDGKASKAMSLVAAADYRIRFREECGFSEGWKEKVPVFFAQESIKIWRKTKRSEKETEIRPWIYRLEVQGDELWMQVSAGSVFNLKPELVVEAFAAYLGEELPGFACQVQREEVYADTGGDGGRVLTPLEELGEEVE
ncbi:MAG TPA: TIGR03936 family radical SAM-associated protein [Candidatus Fusicatenibacter intestinigallinarum]|uniref:TIGR03936 family radical SAM-associated protein n=1 Tax=Candidatus Fusicatenibacter intestinigallinarum TaxID=2838598 RepID=A0A9D2NA55_9FIRM|nr:TIGR03936 family radical SAM-associated protein [Candidatus Fusicatenibacter intestinigallinarum]